MSIQGSTSIYGIIGQPVAHSLSPLFQNWFLNQHGINAAYLPFPVNDAAQIPVVLEGLHGCGVSGFNVTVPYKETVATQVDCDDDARAIGAINTARRTENGWEATNTDHIGIQHVLTSLLGDHEPGEVLLFGAGGTARAVLHACNQMGMARIWLCNRTASRAETLADEAKKQRYATTIAPIAWSQEAVTIACQRSMIVINTTTIGLHDQGAFPFALPPPHGIENGTAFDAVYRPDGCTSFIAAASMNGRYAIDGLPLLIAQGVASFYYWHQLSVNRQRALDYMCHQLHRKPCRMHNWGGDQ